MLVMDFLLITLGILIYKMRKMKPILQIFPDTKLGHVGKMPDLWQAVNKWQLP
jgi:hypothetical protein